AVVGGGIGGSAAAYFLRQKFGRSVQLHVLEKAALGGRLDTLDMEGASYEAGGSVIHPLNLHMKHFVQELGLSANTLQGSPSGVYNGEEFVFEESSWSFINRPKLLWHYGLNPLRMSMWVEDILDKFMRIYRYQMHDYAFSSNERLLHALGGDDFTRLLNQSIDEAMQKAGFSQKFINQVLHKLMNPNVGGILGCSWDSLPARVRITELFPTGDPVKLYEVTYNTSSGLTGDTYDIVVIAAPLGRKMANITFRNFDPPIPEFPNPYHQIITTLVHGRLNTSFFGYQDPQDFHLGAIFTTDNPKLFINSLTLEPPVGDTGTGGQLPLPSAVWKVFSNEELSKEQLSLLFSSYDSVKVKPWLAYPQYSAPEKFPPIVLHEQLYYLNGLERAASAMEMSAIAARNAALLAFHRWHGHSASVDQEDLHERLKTEL
ncbi:PCYOX oxidase, partial [Molothrus ater]|nr:PCYOX oxidase [Molothrus ater]